MDLLRFRCNSPEDAVVECRDDVVVIGYSLREGGHNVVMLKLRSPDLRVQRGQQLTGKGFLSAYDPMTGADLGGGHMGQYLHLNAGGGFVPQTETITPAGGSPTTIRLVRQNAIFTSLAPKAQPGYHPSRHDHASNIFLAACFNAENTGNAIYAIRRVLELMCEVSSDFDEPEWVRDILQSPSLKERSKVDLISESYGNPAE